MFAKNLLDGMSELYRKECEGSQDYDMVLRLTEKAGKIVHIPKILYYWRTCRISVDGFIRKTVCRRFCEKGQSVSS